MKLSGRRVDAFLARPDQAVRAVLVYGADTGLVEERIETLARSVVPDARDPFRIGRIAGPKLLADPAILGDEAAAIALGGGRRVIHIEGATEACAPVLERFLADAMGDALVLVAAESLGPRSALRRLFEETENAAALPCYMDEGEGLARVIRETLGAHKIAPDAEAVAWLAEHLGADRRVTRSELEKLALYLGQPGRLRLEDAMACVGDASALSLDDLTLAAADGDHAQAQRALDKVFAEGTQPVQALRALARHFKRLHLLAGEIASGKTVQAAIDGLKPKPYFRLADRLRAQAGRWSAERAAGALELLLAAEIDAKTTGMPAETLCSRAVMQIARAAERGKR